MKNLKEFTIVWTILLILLVLTFATLFLPFTPAGHFIFGVAFSVIGMYLKKTYCIFREDTTLDKLFGECHE